MVWPDDMFKSLGSRTELCGTEEASLDTQTTLSGSSSLLVLVFLFDFSQCQYLHTQHPKNKKRV